MNQWQCIVDPESNILCAGGWVIGLKTGQSFLVADEALSGVSAPPSSGGGFRSFQSRPPRCFVGGSGRNLRISGTPGTLVPSGYFRAVDAANFNGTLFADARVIYHPDDSVDLHDGTDVLASAGAGTLSTTSVPVGSFPLYSTTYGESTYNGGTPFSVNALPEALPASFVFPSIEVIPNGCTVPEQTFSAADADHYTGDTDATWTLVVNGDGTADLSDTVDIVASRATGDPHQPEGVYQPTAYGMMSYLAPEAENFFLQALLVAASPLPSWIWLEITESAPGMIGTVTGPYRTDTLPSSADPVFRVPLAFTDGGGVFHQIQEGPVYWV